MNRGLSQKSVVYFYFRFYSPWGFRPTNVFHAKA